MDTKLIVSGVLGGLLVLVGAAFVPHKAAVQLGSVTGPDLPYQYLAFGGLRQWASRTDNLVAATTTICAMQSPAATSTLLHASVKFNLASNTAQTITIAKATTAYATTTKLADASIAAGASGTVVASTTSSIALDGIGVFAPNNYVVVGMSGGAAAAGFLLNAPSGTCTALWAEN